MGDSLPARPQQGVFQSFASYSAELSRWRNERDWAWIMGPALTPLCPDFGHVVVHSEFGDESCLYCDYFRCIDCDRMVNDTGWAHVKCERHGDIGPPTTGGCSDCATAQTDGGAVQRICTGGEQCEQKKALLKHAIQPRSQPLGHERQWHKPPAPERPNVSAKEIQRTRAVLKIRKAFPGPLNAKLRKKLIREVLDNQLSID